MKKLKELRGKYHYSYDEMAKRLKISKTYYYQIENGDSRLFYDLAVKIAKIFDLKPDDLFYPDKKRK